MGILLLKLFLTAIVLFIVVCVLYDAHKEEWKEDDNIPVWGKVVLLFGGVCLLVMAIVPITAIWTLI